MYLTKHVIFSPSYGAAHAWLKVDRFHTEKPQVSGISLTGWELDKDGAPAQ